MMVQTLPQVRMQIIDDQEGSGVKIWCPDYVLFIARMKLGDE